MPSLLQVPGVLQIPAFRRLWIALGLSSLGDWLGLLAVTALAAGLSSSYVEANYAVAGVFILRLAPAVALGPLAGAVADRLDRRWTMVIGDVIRFALMLSIPIVGTLTWLYAATFLIECAAMFWTPAKEATVPNLVPRDRLEQANQVGLLATYGAAPVAAAVFAMLTVAGGPLSRVGVSAIDIALVFDAVTFLVSAITIWSLRTIPARQLGREHRISVWATVVEGWRFVARTPVVRSLVLGMLGAFAAGGAVVGLARPHVEHLGAGNPGYGVLFAAVFLGLAAGMGAGPHFLKSLSRRRLFGFAITCAGLCLALLALVPDLVLTAVVTLVLGLFAGLAWVSGYTLLGLEVVDELRGRTFAFVQAMVRVVLVGVLAVAPLLAGTVDRHMPHFGTAARPISYDGAAVVFLVFGLIAAGLGVLAYRQMDDRRGISLRSDLARALRGHDVLPHPSHTGFLLAFEGGEGGGKSTQVRLLAEWLTGQGYDVVTTREPGATPVGHRLRALLLDPASEGLSPRAEALLYAADRAQHVDQVIRPALRRGRVVVTDRYVDSSLAYQGAGRVLEPEDIERLSRWATAGLRPQLTVVLDIPPEVGLQRAGASPDRLESEPVEFHRRVRASFLALADRAPARYLVVDATQPPDLVHRLVRDRVVALLPPPVSRSERAAPTPTPSAEVGASVPDGR